MHPDKKNLVLTTISDYRDKCQFIIKTITENTIVAHSKIRGFELRIYMAKNSIWSIVTDYKFVGNRDNIASGFLRHQLTSLIDDIIELQDLEEENERLIYAMNHIDLAEQNGEIGAEEKKILKSRIDQVEDILVELHEGQEEIVKLIKTKFDELDKKLDKTSDKGIIQDVVISTIFKIVPSEHVEKVVKIIYDVARNLPEGIRGFLA